MNRLIRRALKKNDKAITKIVRNMTIRRLKEHDIDYNIVLDNIISTRAKDVQDIYNATMTQVIADFNRCGGSLHKLKQIYNL